MPRNQPRNKPNTAEHTERRARLVILLVGALVVIAVTVFAVIQATRPPANVAEPQSSGTTQAQGDLTVRENSRRLNNAPNATVTFVEFLDFECEACAAAFPAIEQLRQTYGDQVSFVIRYFPLPSHFNSERAARAVEAAAQQGQLEAMYRKMYETQTEWGEQQIPKDDLFRQYAEELGLDMEQWEEAYNSQTTLQFIQNDFNDGVELGVSGTPTFFLDGKRIDPNTFAELTTMIDQALQE